MSGLLRTADMEFGWCMFGSGPGTDQHSVFYEGHLRDNLPNCSHCAGAGIGRMLDTFQPLGVFTNS